MEQFGVSPLPIHGTMGARAETMNSVLQKFLVGKEEHKAKDNTKRVQPITHDARYGSTREATASFVHRRRFASRFLAWIARQIHPDLSYHISMIQSTFENACVRGSRECNYTVEYAAFASTRGIDVIPDSSWENAVVVRLSDASFCQEQEQLDGVTQDSESQQAGITALAPGDALNAVRMLILLSWSLTGITRVCRSSPKVEAYVLSNDVEQGFFELELLSLT